MSAVVMVVEDDFDILALTRYALERAGHEVIGAASGEQAVEELDRRRPDMIFLDIRLPGMDGWQVLEHVRGTPETERLPVVIMSAHTSPDTLARARDEATGHLVKPFRPAELVEWVDRALAS
jgi:CheY-like chemotaxis protein